MQLSRRGLLTGAAGGVLLSGAVARGAEPAPGALTEKSLGELLESLTLKPDKQQQRYDFAFLAPFDDQKWELSMSAVLSQDGTSIWIMAWLDECPKSASEVPRTALLRLLAENDKLGGGKFFAYIPSNRRFVLQQVIPNDNMTSARFKVILQDLGTTVVETHSTWSVAGWNQAAPTGPGGTEVQTAGRVSPGAATTTATNESKFASPVVK
ncbi:hypothetical protein Pan44_30630 [Caulifigura coniformis]|uniref:Uncharacterized protein n=1 Tax=Caulifigura coniformis TaxID=2527983 RepID=A0A517SFX0_9PLAN|nr:type III secretion system chaperone [Caulifigura coniformis]QDT55022.1 hypothetical protein Pan44_30630 [Caulifigura coniformis]